ncbi:GntR family transcriptional regulator [Allostella humosa]|nr:GntR family transcriptional regulator [Stella humosa]
MPEAGLVRSVGAALHRQVFVVLKDWIVSGRYAAGRALLPEEALARAFGVSRITVRRALADLEQAGLVERRHGRGTFVRPPPAAEPLQHAVADVEAAIARTGQLRARVLEFDHVVPPPDVRAALELAVGEKAQRAVRVRHRDGLPIMHLTTYVPDAIGRTYDRADMETTPLYELLRRAGRGYRRAEQRIGAALADPHIAGLLQLDAGAPLLHIRRRLLDGDGRPVEDLTMLASPQRYQLRTVHNWEDPAAGPIVSYETTLAE